MDQVECRGNEFELAQCIFDGWGNHDCSHYEDAGAVCEGVCEGVWVGQWGRV